MTSAAHGERRDPGTALVLGGSGPAALAWQIGVLHGLADADEGLAEKLMSAGTVIGTSSGSCVAAMITSGAPLDHLYDMQLSVGSAELETKVDLADFLNRLRVVTEGAVDETDRRQRVGGFALAASTVPERTRREVIATRLPTTEWPTRDLRIPAVDALTGEVAVFTRDSSVTLVDAVTASCAVPGVWPPASIDGRRYIDGGVRSSTNADLAIGAQRILIITPAQADVPCPSLCGDLRAELQTLRSSHVEVIYADRESWTALANPLSAAARGLATHAGRTVGRTAAIRVGQLLESSVSSSIPRKRSVSRDGCSEC